MLETVQSIAAKFNSVIVSGEIHALNGLPKCPMNHWPFGLLKRLSYKTRNILETVQRIAAKFDPLIACEI